MTLLKGEELTAAASIQLGIFLSPQDPGLQIGADTLSYQDLSAGEIIQLDSSLQVSSRIALPADLAGTPLLSSEGKILYYCTPKALRAWDLDSGIRRTVKEMAYDGQSVTALLMTDTIVQCTSGQRNFFLNAATGQLLQEFEGEIRISTVGNTYCASASHGLMDAAIFGTADTCQILLPDQLYAPCQFFPEANAALIFGSDSTLECYDLATGFRQSVLTLNTGHSAKAAASLGSDIWLLYYDDQFGCDTLYRWDPAQTAVNDGICYTFSYSPDSHALAQCQSYADLIGAAHGITILTGLEATASAPWDYTLEAETCPALLERELEQLEKCLARFPEGFLKEAAEPFSGLTLSLVKSLSSAPEAGGLNAATGVQFLEGTQAHAVIGVGPYSEQALYHELFHILETKIFNESIAFDQWDKLNPAGFRYDFDYAANAVRDSGIYLKGDTRAFVDTYSMSYPKEDRARIFEYAMLPGFCDLFAAPAMQDKLKAVCEGIREAWDLENSQETYPWEQYLEEPLH